HPLYRRVLDVDPELLLPLVVDRFGSTQQAAIEVVAEQVEEGQRDGSIRAIDPRLAATCLQLTAQSFVFSARVVEGQDVLPELRRLLDSYLRP
ncbi:MAG: TetR/AcrR family transcriptional regulator, partial [Actinobacteria bacterium]|nr:TetR/AcrR family transcriptional regulator [Actinomycetota bacterium]MCA1722530.1 TetR/AcrR family transcriptional regulator [Actinomycetota bacterium]